MPDCGKQRSLSTVLGKTQALPSTPQAAPKVIVRSEKILDRDHDSRPRRTGFGMLHNRHLVPIFLEDVRDIFPTGAIGESSMHQNHVLIGCFHMTVLLVVKIHSESLIFRTANAFAPKPLLCTSLSFNVRPILDGGYFVFLLPQRWGSPYCNPSDRARSLGRTRCQVWCAINAFCSKRGLRRKA
jgi:hypothetical protein